MGQSFGRWEGDTLVVDVTGQNDQTWFDRSGTHHSNQLHVVERYTMTTPNHSGARVFHAIAVAVLAWAWQMLLYRPAGPVWALFLLAPLVPLLDHLFTGAKHAWKRPQTDIIGPRSTPPLG